MGISGILSLFERPCLVDIDTQADFALPSGSLYVPAASELIPLWKELTQFGQTHHLPMVASMDCHLPDDPEFANFPPHCLAGTLGQKKLAETLAKEFQIIEMRKHEATVDFESQLILEKNTLDVFANPHAAEIFGALNCTSFAVYGLTTEYCVRAAVLGLLQRGYRAYVIADAVRAADPAAGERALAEIANAGAGFIHSGTFVEKVLAQLANRGQASAGGRSS